MNFISFIYTYHTYENVLGGHTNLVPGVVAAVVALVRLEENSVSVVVFLVSLVYLESCFTLTSAQALKFKASKEEICFPIVLGRAVLRKD